MTEPNDSLPPTFRREKPIVTATEPDVLTDAAVNENDVNDDVVNVPSTPAAPETEALDDAIAAAQSEREVAGRDTTAAKANALKVAGVCDEFRGEDVLVLDLSSITPEFDYFVIATANSRRQMHAMVDEVDRVLDFAGAKRRSIEGYENTAWVVQDYGDVVLHVFLPEARELYDLENLWGDAPRVAWQAAE